MSLNFKVNGTTGVVDRYLAGLADKNQLEVRNSSYREPDSMGPARKTALYWGVLDQKTEPYEAWKQANPSRLSEKDLADILASAKKEYADAGLDPADASKWSAMYNKSKNEARQQALSQILAAWRAGSS